LGKTIRNYDRDSMKSFKPVKKKKSKGKRTKLNYSIYDDSLDELLDDELTYEVEFSDLYQD